MKFRCADTPDELDEEDLELIREVEGGSAAAGKRSRTDGDDDDAMDGRGDNAGQGAGLSIFDDNEPVAGSGRPSGAGGPSGSRGLVDDDDEDLEDFIDDDEDDEDEEDLDGGATGAAEREARRAAAKAERRQAKREAREKQQRLGGAGQWAGAGRETREQLTSVFGDGEDYAQFLQPQRFRQPMSREERSRAKQGPSLKDVFEPAEIADRFLLPQDDQIRKTDIPERHQMSTSTLSREPVLYDLQDYPDLDSATAWIAPRLSERATRLFLGTEVPDENNFVLDYDMSGQIIGRHEVRPDLREAYYAAVRFALESLFVKHFEVPHIWHHLRDELIEKTDDRNKYATLVDRDEIWDCYDMGLRYRAIAQRRSLLQETYDRLKQAVVTDRETGEQKPFVPDAYFEDFVIAVPDGTAEQSVEGTNEALAWLETRYPEYMRVIKQESSEDDRRGGDEYDAAPVARQKRPGEGATAKRLTREGPLAGFIDRVGISPSQVAINVRTASQAIRSVDPEKEQVELASNYLDPAQGLMDEMDVVAAAKELLILEFGRDPVLLLETRNHYSRNGLITCRPTEKGKSKIDDMHIFREFKYTREKPLSELDKMPVFCQMLAAEAEGLIDISLTVNEVDGLAFEQQLRDAYQPPHPVGSIQPESSWHTLRDEIVVAALRHHLIPSASTWIKEDLRQRTESSIAKQCQVALEIRVNVQPFATAKMQAKNRLKPSVCAISSGRGGKDAVQAIFINDERRLLAQQQYDNMVNQNNKDQFTDSLKQYKPDVIVIGGFSVETARLRSDVDLVLTDIVKETMYGDRNAPQPGDGLGGAIDQMYQDYVNKNKIPLIYVSDDVARIYMNSERARDENPELPANARYALALARYAQDPLNEYCALGPDLAAVLYIPRFQPYISQETLLYHLERGLVNVVNDVGVHLRQAVGDAYVAKQLPFVAGLGPRKAEAIIRSYTIKGRQPVCRADDVEGFQVNALLNAAGFLIFNHPLADLLESSIRDDNDRARDYDDEDDDDLMDGGRGRTNRPNPDPLDATRIHPLDYGFARELCENIDEVDPDDAINPSKTVLRFMKQDKVSETLDQYDLNEFVKQIRERDNGAHKAYTVALIEAELAAPFKDRRPPFILPTEWDVLTMLTGETEDTIGLHRVVNAFVSGIRRDRAFIRLESKVAGEIPIEYISDDAQEGQSIDLFISKSQTVRGVIVDIRPAELWVQVSIRQSDVLQAVTMHSTEYKDIYWDVDLEQRDMKEAEKRRQREEANIPRILTHPDWHILNRREAEAYLKDRNRGDAVIRPSSKGRDHLAVTWKVDEGIYQHLDVLELDKPDPSRLGRILRVNNDASYQDLDELLVSHVGQMAHAIDRLTQHEKYRHEDEVQQYLGDYVMAHPGSSAYCFSLDKQRPGWAKVSFLSVPLNRNGRIQAWVSPRVLRVFASR